MYGGGSRPLSAFSDGAGIRIEALRESGPRSTTRRLPDAVALSAANLGSPEYLWIDSDAQPQQDAEITGLPEGTEGRRFKGRFVFYRNRVDDFTQVGVKSPGW